MKKILFTSPNVAELVDYDIDAPKEGEIQVRILRSTISAGTERANVAVEVTGIGKALDQVLDCMAPFGKVALLGCTRHSDFTIDYYHKVHAPGISLIGAHTKARPKYESSPDVWTEADDMKTLIRFANTKRLDLEGLVDRAVSPSAAPEIYSELSEGRSFPTTQFDWSLL